MRCPRCGSQEVTRYGFAYAGGKKQRYLCKKCGRTFLLEKRRVGGKKCRKDEGPAP
jgi:transposase-like protein